MQTFFHQGAAVILYKLLQTRCDSGIQGLELAGQARLLLEITNLRCTARCDTSNTCIMIVTWGLVSKHGILACV